MGNTPTDVFYEAFETHSLFYGSSGVRCAKNEAKYVDMHVHPMPFRLRFPIVTEEDKNQLDKLQEVMSVVFENGKLAAKEEIRALLGVKNRRE